MPLRTWHRITWAYYILFAIAVTWPIQASCEQPDALHPRSAGTDGMGAAAWILGGLVVLWRLDAARTRESLPDTPAGKS